MYVSEVDSEIKHAPRVHMDSHFQQTIPPGRPSFPYVPAYVASGFWWEGRKIIRLVRCSRDTHVACLIYGHIGNMFSVNCQQ